MMSDSEVVLSLAIVFLSIAMTIISVKLWRYDKYFHGIHGILTMLGIRIIDLEKHKEKEKVNV
jgi:hypothetical protein